MIRDSWQSPKHIWESFYPMRYMYTIFIEVSFSLPLLERNKKQRDKETVDSLALWLYYFLVRLFSLSSISYLIEGLPKVNNNFNQPSILFLSRVDLLLSLTFGPAFAGLYLFSQFNHFLSFIERYKFLKDYSIEIISIFKRILVCRLDSITCVITHRIQ